MFQADSMAYRHGTILLSTQGRRTFSEILRHQVEDTGQRKPGELRRAHEKGGPDQMLLLRAEGWLRETGGRVVASLPIPPI